MVSMLSVSSLDLFCIWANLDVIGKTLGFTQFGGQEEGDAVSEHSEGITQHFHHLSTQLAINQHKRAGSGPGPAL